MQHHRHRRWKRQFVFGELRHHGPGSGPLQLTWIANAALAQAVAGQTISPLAGPINLIGQSSTFGAVLVASKTGYIGTFNAPVLSGACGANLTAPTTTTPTTLGTNRNARLGAELLLGGRTDDRRPAYDGCRLYDHRNGQCHEHDSG